MEYIKANNGVSTFLRDHCKFSFSADLLLDLKGVIDQNFFLKISTVRLSLLMGHQCIIYNV